MDLATPTFRAQQAAQTSDFKTHQLPLARIKKIMKSDEDVQMISAEAPVIFAKACDLLISELTLRSWMHTQENKRRTLQRNDLAMAVTKCGVFDFLIDIVPREDVHTKAKSEAMLQPEQVQQYYLQLHQAQQAQLAQAAASTQLGMLAGTSSEGLQHGAGARQPNAADASSMMMMYGQQQAAQHQQPAGLGQALPVTQGVDASGALQAGDQQSQQLAQYYQQQHHANQQFLLQQQLLQQAHLNPLRWQQMFQQQHHQQQQAGQPPPQLQHPQAQQQGQPHVQQQGMSQAMQQLQHAQDMQRLQQQSQKP